MRGLIRGWLINDVPLANLIDDRVFPVNMMDVKPSSVPYIVYRLGVQTPRIVPAQNETLQIWAHDNRGDYGKIDDILARAKEILEGIEPQGLILAINWLDTSEDQYDEATSTITKFSRYEIVSTT